jgi:UMF1 family MFS transporter
MFKITKKTGEEKVKWGWAMYDWANNVYSLVITTAIFPLYFTALTSSTNENGDEIDKVIFFGNEFTNSQLYSYVLAASFLTVIMLSPILSGIADFTGKKKLFMRVFTYTGAAGCIGLFWFHPEHLEWSLSTLLVSGSGEVSGFTMHSFPRLRREKSTTA